MDKIQPCEVERFLLGLHQYNTNKTQANIELRIGRVLKSLIEMKKDMKAILAILPLLPEQDRESKKILMKIKNMVERIPNKQIGELKGVYSE